MSLRKVIFFVIGILLACVIGYSIHKILRPHQNVSGTDASARISAAELYNQFINSEAEANKKWIGRVIEVKGVVSSITETGNFASIQLNVNDGGINCSFLKTDLDKKINKGDTVTIKGKCTGFLMDVNFVDCVLVSS